MEWIRGWTKWKYLHSLQFCYHLYYLFFFLCLPTFLPGVFLKTNIAGDCVSFSDMQLSTKITFQDTHMKGLKLSYGISYMPVIG